MSLLDALLLDPPRIDVWIAWRTTDGSGPIGTGTQVDPYDGGVSAGTAKAISSFSATGNLITANATGHGFVQGNVVWISGATDPALNGTFRVESALANSFTFHSAAVPAVTTGGGSARNVTEFRFDTVMRSLLGPNTTVHLGPGEFPTAGYHEGMPVGISWQMRPGLRIVGSGIDVTRLKLINGTADNDQVYVIGHDLTTGSPSVPNALDFAEISEMTIDCYLTGLLDNFSATGAVRLMGSHSRVARVKAINWGRRSGGPSPGYVIAMLTGDAPSGVAGVVNCGIESCIVVNRDAASFAGMVALHVGGREGASGAQSTLGTGAYIRNCFVDGGGTGTPVDIRALSMALCRGGVVEGNQVLNVTSGGPYQTATGAYDITVRNNNYRNVGSGPSWVMSANGVSKLVIMGNSIELATGSNGLWAVNIDDNGAGSPPFGTVIVRDNLIRYLDGDMSAGNTGKAIQVNGATAFQGKENVVQLVPANPILTQRCTAATFFENRTPAGSLVQGVNGGNSSVYTELATDADDAFILGLLLRS
jgi:hypothetical protein